MATDLLAGNTPAAGPTDLLAATGDVATAAPEPTGEPSTLGGVARSFAQGATLNFSDEAEAAIRSLFGDETYQQELAQIRDEIEEFRKENPNLALGSELGGAVLTALVPGTAAVRGATAASRIGRAALGGAATGAGAGVGAGEDATGRLLGGVTGAALGGATGAAVPAIGGVVGKAVNRIRGKQKDFVPTTADIRATKKAFYKAFDQGGRHIKPEVFKKAVDKAMVATHRAGFRPKVQTKVVVPLAELEAVAQKGKSVSLQEIELLRRVFTGARKEIGTDDARIANIALGEIDDMIGNLKANQLTRGQGPRALQSAKQAAKDVRTARALHRRELKSRILDGMIERAENKATAQGSRQGLDLNLRTEFLQLANNMTRSTGPGKRLSNLFTNEERQLIRRAAQGSRPENTFTRLGRTFAPTNPLGMMAGPGMGGAIGAAVAGPAGAAIGAGTLGAVGAGSRAIGNRLTRANVQTAEDFIRSGGRVGAQAAENPQLEAILNALAIGGASRTVPQL